MKDVVGTLKRIDDEIVQRRQAIAYNQVEIARLEDTRRVLMSLAEDDDERAEAARHPERVEVQPVVQSITVRKIVPGDPPPKTNGNGAHLNKSGDMRGMNNPRKKLRAKASEIPQEERQEYLRERVITVLKTGGAMDTADIRKALGMQGVWHKSRKVKALYNAISHLKRTNAIVQNPEDFTLSLSS